MLVQNCAISSIAPYQPSAVSPWNERRIVHLYRRLGFGANYDEIQTALSMSPGDLVDQLIDTAAALPDPPNPYWSDYTTDDYAGMNDERFVHLQELLNRWLRNMITEGVRSKFALFWHGHFVTSWEAHECTSYTWSYFDLLHKSAFGNFKGFVEEMGKNPSMLVYLNGNVSVAGEPNENYARELMELFTMGANNGYTQSDIVNVSRALTGWKANQYQCTPAYFESADFDSGSKTIFGQTGNWNYDDVHNLIFTERQNEVAYYICEEIYKFFVYPEVNTDIVSALAATFVANNWELIPVFKQLFKSEHFFDETLIGAHIKSPLELFAGLYKTAELEYPSDYDDNTLGYILYQSMNLGQDLINPPNVSGWDGYRAWINENTMTNRWSFVANFMYGFSEAAKDRLRQTVLTGVSNSTDPEVITDFIAKLYCNRTLEPQHLTVAVQYLKAGIPENYFDDGSWNLYWNEAPDQIINLLIYLSRLPEFQMV